MRLPPLLLAAALLALTACSAAPPSGSPSSASPRVRCVADPRERDTRPLVYLLCIESP